MWRRPPREPALNKVEGSRDGGLGVDKTEGIEAVELRSSGQAGAAFPTCNYLNGEQPKKTSF
jgi:hypothetical protein